MYFCSATILWRMKIFNGATRSEVHATHEVRRPFIPRCVAMYWRDICWTCHALQAFLYGTAPA